MGSENFTLTTLHTNFPFIRFRYMNKYKSLDLIKVVTSFNFPCKQSQKFRRHCLFHIRNFAVFGAGRTEDSFKDSFVGTAPNNVKFLP